MFVSDGLCSRAGVSAGENALMTVTFGKFPSRTLVIGSDLSILAPLTEEKADGLRRAFLFFTVRSTSDPGILGGGGWLSSRGGSETDLSIVPLWKETENGPLHLCFFFILVCPTSDIDGLSGRDWPSFAPFDPIECLKNLRTLLPLGRVLGCVRGGSREVAAPRGSWTCPESFGASSADISSRLQEDTAVYFDDWGGRRGYRFFKSDLECTGG